MTFECALKRWLCRLGNPEPDRVVVVDVRGLAVGLAVGGYGAGSAIFGPLSSKVLIPAYGWRSTFMILGGVFFVMTLIGAFLLKNPPTGYRPVGWTPSITTAKSASQGLSPAQLLRTPNFYFLWMAYALGTSAGLMVISQLVPFARSQGIPFYCLKAVSDTASEVLPDFSRYTDTQGQLQLAALLAHVAIRPRYWPGLARMGKNGKKGAHAMASALGPLVGERG